MTLTALQNVPEFQKLKDDPRFIALITYMYSHPKLSALASLEHKAGEFQAWHNCLNQMESIFTDEPKTDGKPSEKRAPYTHTP